MKRLAVFCGSSLGASEKYKEGAILLGEEFIRQNITLVYGGSSIGLMGVVADVVLEAGGNVIGVIPSFLEEKEISHPHLTELIVVESMHERKAKMMELADGFVVLPGGTGTLEEFFEVFTWGQIGLHRKPCGLLNLHHYYDPLITLFDHMCEQKFLQQNVRDGLIVESDPVRLLERFEKFDPPPLKQFKE